MQPKGEMNLWVAVAQLKEEIKLNYQLQDS